MISDYVWVLCSINKTFIVTFYNIKIHVKYFYFLIRAGDTQLGDK